MAAKFDVAINLENVKKFMKCNKLTEYSLAKVMNVSYSYVYRVMRGQRGAGRLFVNGLIKSGMKPNDIFLISVLPKGNKNSRSPVA